MPRTATDPVKNLRVPMPGSAKASLWLFLLSWPVEFVYSLIFDSSAMPALPQPPQLYGVLLGAVVLCAIALNITLRAYQGRNWARWILALANIWVVPVALRDWLLQFPPVTSASSIHMAFVLVNALCVALLFSPECNRWYRQCPRVCKPTDSCHPLRRLS